MQYVMKSIIPAVMNDDHIKDPINRNTPNMINANTIIEKLVLSIRLSKNPFELLSILLTLPVKLHPHSVQNSMSSSVISFPQPGQYFLTVI